MTAWAAPARVAVVECAFAFGCRKRPHRRDHHGEVLGRHPAMTAFTAAFSAVTVTLRVGTSPSTTSGCEPAAASIASTALERRRDDGQPVGPAAVEVVLDRLDVVVVAVRWRSVRRHRGASRARTASTTCAASPLASSFVPHGGRVVRVVDVDHRVVGGAEQRGHGLTAGISAVCTMHTAGMPAASRSSASRMLRVLAAPAAAEAGDRDGGVAVIVAPTARARAAPPRSASRPSRCRPGRPAR